MCPWWKTIRGENNTSEPTLIKVLDELHIEGTMTRFIGAQQQQQTTAQLPSSSCPPSSCTGPSRHTILSTSSSSCCSHDLITLLLLLLPTRPCHPHPPARPAAHTTLSPSHPPSAHTTLSLTLLLLLSQHTGRDPAAPLRIPVLDRYHDRGTVALGKVESGSVRVGMKVRHTHTHSTGGYTV